MSTRTAHSTYLGTRYITDGRVFGLVKETNDRKVFIVDVTTGKQHGLHAREVRRMTPSEIERYNGTPSKWDPQPDQLLLRAAEIRGSWDRETRRKRQQPRYLPIGEMNDV